MAQCAFISCFPAPRESVRDSGVALGLWRSAPVTWRWPSEKGQTQTSIQVGGTANALMRFGTSGLESPAPVAAIRKFVTCFLPAYPWARGFGPRFLDRQLPARYQAKSTSIKTASICPKNWRAFDSGFRSSPAPVIWRLLVIQMSYARNKRGVALLSGPVNRLPLCFECREYVVRMIFHHIVVYRASLLASLGTRLNVNIRHLVLLRR
jgi:hypothetical protein